MKITPEILEAINRACDHYGDLSHFARKMKVAHSTVLFWRSGKTTHISGRLWVHRAYPLLKKFMQGKESFSQRTFISGGNTQSATIKENHLAAQTSVAEFQKFDPCLESPVSFASRSKDQAAFGTVCKDSCWAIQWDSSMGDGNLPDGCSILLDSDEYAKSGDVVLIKLIQSQEIVFGHYFKENNQIQIVPIHPKQKKIYQWLFQENSSYVFWMYPVIEVNMKLRKTT